MPQTSLHPEIRNPKSDIAQRPRAVTWRSVLLGLIGVVAICALSPYNDWVVSNTFLIGNFIPVGLLLYFGLLTIAINAPLLRWAPRVALNSRELTVAMAMVLVSCSLPGAGLMRYLPTQLVGIWYWGGQTPDTASYLRSLNLPDWMFPALTSADPVERGNSAVVQNYYGQIPQAGDTFWSRFTAVPWSLWTHPAIAWGLFTLALFGSILCLLLIVRRQWTENERLPFPLAGIFTAMIEPPERGRSLNPLFRSVSFWVAFAVVFLIHAINAMSQYQPQYFPKIPISYNLSSIFTNEPWTFLDTSAKVSSLYFCIIGISFFLPSQISLSIWLFFILNQIQTMMAGTYRTEIAGPMKADQFWGALLPYALSVVWIGRQHWATVVRQMFRGARAGESFGRYLPYALIGWALVGFMTLGIVFLCAAGASFVGAVACMLLLLTLHLALARIVAETGLPFVGIGGGVDRPFLAVLGAQGNGLRTTDRSYFLTQMIGAIYANDIRESNAVYLSHAYRLGDEMYDDAPTGRGWRRTLPFTLCLILSLVVGFFVAGASKLYTEYNFSVSLDATQHWPLDEHATTVNVRDSTLLRSRQYAVPTGPQESHNRLEHIGIGLTISTVLAVARLKSVSFPLHPVGYLLCYTYPVARIWFSVMVGWLVKTLIVKFAGSSGYHRCRSFFIGLILGEAGAAAFWLVVALVFNAMGLPYKSILLLPT